MNRPSMKEIIKNGESYYSLVVGVAKRARVIVDEALDEGLPSSDNPVAESVDDFAKGKYEIVEPERIDSGCYD